MQLFLRPMPNIRWNIKIDFGDFSTGVNCVVIVSWLLQQENIALSAREIIRQMEALPN